MVFKTSLYDNNQAIEAQDHKKHPLEEIALEQHHEFLPQFGKVLADRLPPHRAGIEHEVSLKDGGNTNRETIIFNVKS